MCNVQPYAVHSAVFWVWVQCCSRLLPIYSKNNILSCPCGFAPCMLLLSHFPLPLQFPIVLNFCSIPLAEGRVFCGPPQDVQVPGSHCLMAAKQNIQQLQSASLSCITFSLFHRLFSGPMKELNLEDFNTSFQVG